MSGKGRLSAAPEPVAETVAPDEADRDGKRGPTQATMLVDLATSRFELWQAPGGDLFAVPRIGPRIPRLLRGSGESLRAELARLYNVETGAVPSQGALADALRVLEGRAQRAPLAPLFLRVAEHEGRIVVDLGDETGRAIVVEPGSWALVDEPPIFFRRTALTGALSPPAAGGSLDELRSLVHVTDESWPLVVGWLVTTFLPDVPVPILFFRGSQGAGKSVTARLLSRLLDPSPAQLRSAPRERDWHAAGACSHVLALDNISRIPEWFADALCRAVTGEAGANRALYTDRDVSVYSFKLSVILTAVAVEGVRGDLGDRLLPIELERLDERERRVESELEAAFASAHPRVLGALLDLVASVLEVLPDTRPDRLPRLADAGRVFAAVDRVRGTSSFDAFMGAAGSVAADVVDDDPVAHAVLELAERTGQWEGSTAELLDTITPRDASGNERRPRGWPETPQALRSHLARAEEALRLVGVRVERLGKGAKGKRKLRLAWTGAAALDTPRSESRGQSSPQTPPSPPSAWLSHFPGGGTGGDPELAGGDAGPRGGDAPPIATPSPPPSPLVDSAWLSQVRAEGGDVDDHMPPLYQTEEKRGDTGSP